MQTSATVTVRYFAGAAEAAGREEEQVTLPAGSTLADLKAVIAAAHGADLQRVLTAASFLLDDLAGDTERVVPPGARVDVLPPFAGG